MKKVIAKKHLGQNFLKDESVIGQIFSVAEVTPKDWVLEIGPGTGALTVKLVSRVERLLAIEIDQDLAGRLQSQFVDSKKVTILVGDILRINVEEILETIGFARQPYKIIANIPYYITAPIIRTLLSLRIPPNSLTLMVQNEVADRLAAKPGSMSLLSVMAQYYALVEKKIFVPRTAFDPVPNVDSAVVTLHPKRKYSPENDRKLFRLVRAGFAARRKTLVNNLATSFSLSRAQVEERLRSIGLRLDIRAQALSVSDWERLVDVWQQKEQDLA